MPDEADDASDLIAAEQPPPRVFISYAWGRPEHEADVKRLWLLLRELGIEALMDVGVDDLGHHWRRWIEQEILRADFVLVIASPEYQRRADDDEAPEDEGRGVWWEANQLGDMVYRDKGRQSLRKILPVVLPGSTLDDLPRFFTPYGRTNYRISEITEAGLAPLLRVLYRQPSPGAPVVGARRPLHNGLTLDVSVAHGKLRTRAALAGVRPAEREAPVPIGLETAWSALDSSPATAAFELAELGLRLSRALLDPELLTALTERVTGLPLGATFDVVVRTDGPGLSIPFELMRLADGRPLSTMAGVSFLRRVGGLDRDEAPALPGPLKILAAVAAPESPGRTSLDVEAEAQAIVDGLEGLDAQVKILEVASLEQIVRALRRDAYHVLHLSAHSDLGSVELEDEYGSPTATTAELMMRALKRANRPLPLIVLSSCGGAGDGAQGLATELIRQGADRVVAMQTSVSDGYATPLISRLYATLARDNPSVAAALGAARGSLYDELESTAAVPEFGVPTLLAAGGDPPLVDPAAAVVKLRRPVATPAQPPVHELRLGELIGRRDQLRQILRALRGGAQAERDFGAISGVQLRGPAGIGKSALAARVVSRLRGDDEPWRTAVHHGAWDARGVLATVLIAMARSRPARTEEGPDDDAGDGATALGVLQRLLSEHRLLLVLEDFDENLTRGGEVWVDPEAGKAFEALCGSASTSKLLVIGRHPVPGETNLLPVDLPPLSPAELHRLLRRQPALRDLRAPARRSIVDTIGGHPRLVEFLDTLLRGQGGRGRRPEVTTRMRALANQAPELALPRPRRTPELAEAVSLAVELGRRDLRLDELLTLLTPSERETLLQAAVSRIPFSVEDLVRALDCPHRTVVEAEAERLVGLTLLATVGSELVVLPWVAACLAPEQGDELPHRHDRAELMRRGRIEAGRGDLDDLYEVAHHLGTAGRLDELAGFALDVAAGFTNDAIIAAFLGQVIAVFPREHPSLVQLMSRELSAIAALGDRVAAMRRAHEVVAVARQELDSHPDSRRARLTMSVAYDQLGHLARSDGDAATARGFFSAALEIAGALVEADPNDHDHLRRLSVAYGRLGDLARDEGDVEAAWDLQQLGLAIRQRLVEAEPGNAEYRGHLSLSYQRLGDLAHDAGTAVTARPLYERSFAILLGVIEAEPSENLRSALSVSYNKLADLARTAGEVSTARAFYERARRIRHELVDGDPANLDHQHDLAVSYGRLGQLSTDAGDLVGAREQVEQSLAVARRLAEAEPTRVAFQHTLMVASTQLGDIVRAGGDTPGARGLYERALAAARRLAAATPGSLTFRRGVSLGLDRLGDLARVAGDRLAARDLYEQSLAVASGLAAAHPTYVDFQLDLSILFHKLGDLADPDRDRATARGFYERSLAIGHRLLRADPGNVNAQRHLSLSHDRLGDLAARADDLVAARIHYGRCMDLAGRLAGNEPDDVHLQRNLSVVHNKLGDVAANTDDPVGARAHYELALAIRLRLVEADQGSLGLQRDLAHSYERLGDLARGQGDPGAAGTLYEQARSLVLRLDAIDPADVGYREDVARLTEALERLESSG